ncbi:RUN and SH3 domain-containing protein 1 isoform X1 [Protopterus annectens]|uniref:RUN and SH3 domain-containing protein 1 isoform X1 n=1 Tax=Protopterus annectens TaxID=7888 RepID=UPI001CFA55BB|nr:RUN and SH3 domain-containing protein 1 isoform X1 [Protopterus annectens]
MLAPEKCILKNLNTVHLRNISASLRTLNHNNESNANGKSAQKETWEKELCSLCLHKNCIPSEVDANFNNPSFPCMCCQLHPPQLEKLPAQPLARNTVSTTNVESLSPTTLLSPSQFTASPTSSSSISSCSDFDSDSSPNSTCSKEFPSEDQDEEATSPLSQPTIVPLEEHDFRSDTNEQKKHDILSHRECHQPKSESSLYSVTLSASEANTPDILCQSNYSTSNTPSKVSAINSETDNKTATSAVELLNNQHIPRFTPLHKNSENLDSEQNGTQVSTRQPSAAAGNLGHILINGETQAPTHCTQHNQPLILSMGKKTPDLVNKNSANCSEHAIASPHDLPDSTISSAPNTQINVIFDSLNTHHFCLDNEKQRSNINEPSKKTVTSFHELAQKRKKSTLGQQIQGRNDKSDWLIVFSPDTELPPASELSQAAFEQKQMRAAPESDEDRRGPNVTTFKELRYKNALTKQNSQQSHNYSLSAPAEFCGRSGTNLQQLVEDRQYELVKDHYHPLNEEAEGKPSLTDYGSSGNDSGIGSPEEDLLPQLKGHIVTYFEHMPRRKKSSSTLQPIEEWPVNELSDGELKKEYALNKRKGVQGEETLRFTGRSTYLEEYQVRGKADGGDKGSKHAGPVLTQGHRPQTLHFQPIVFHFPADGNAVCASLCSASDPPSNAVCHQPPNLENCDVKSPVLLGPSFCSKLKTVSCDEVCLLAAGKTRDFAFVSPEELLPMRLSPVGDYSPPQRGAPPLLQSPSLSSQLAPFFPRSRTFPTLFLPSQLSSELLMNKGTARIQEKDSGEEKNHGPEDTHLHFSSVSLFTWHKTNQRNPAEEKHSEYGALCHQRLLNAVSSSVDKLVSYFSTTRNLVQKAQLGDSRISPEVGHLVLFGLNPALLAVLKDGLKPYQNDVIVGRRKNSVWRMVEASVKPGPETIAFYSLYCKICKLPQLKTSRMRFNAFIFGLLNLKLLEFWFSHLRQCTDILSMHYEPKAFLSLSNTSLKHLFDELLLLLQPLSILTFNLHILFEHCHHFVEDAEQLNNHTVFKQTEKRLSVLHANKRRENTSSSNQYPRGLTTELKTLSHMQRGTNKPDSENIIDECAEKSECYGKLPSQRNVCVEEGLVCSTSRSLTENRKQSVEQSQNAVGETLQHTFEQVVQWGDRLAQNLVKFKEQHNGPANVPQVQVKSEEKSSRVSNVNEMATERKPVNWWEQLSQTSRVYISPSKEGSFLAKWLKPKTPDAVHNSIFSSSKQNESFRSEPLVILRVQNTKEHTMEIKKDESVPAENSINNNYSECSVAVQKKEPKTNDTGVLQNTDKPSDDSASENRGTGEGAVKRDDVDNECHYTKPEKNCSPPSVQCDVRNLDNSYAFNKLENTRTEMLPSIGSTMWMGRIFGATSPSNRTSQDEQGANQLKSRRPSSWLAPNLNVFGQARKGTITERVMPPLVLEEADTVSSDEETKPQRAVKALCSHTGQGEHELSFEKGDILKVVSNVDENWIRCCHGDKIGIVPVEYTSLIL